MSLPQSILLRLGQWLGSIGFRRDWYLIPLAALVGAMAGVVALGFGRLVEFSEEFFFGRIAGGKLGGERWWLILVLPALGGLLVGLIKLVFRLPLTSHGVPEVMEAIARRRGDVPARMGVFSSINPALTIGSGGSAGQEGPIIAIGSALGSVIGKLLHVNRQDLSTLVGCGAAAGLAAVFNAPIAGVLLVLEVLLRDFSLRTFMPVVVASVFGVAVFQAVAGRNEALFTIPGALLNYEFNIIEIVPYLLLGVGCGVVGWLFTRTAHGAERLFVRLPLPKVILPMVGGLILGAMGVAFAACFPKVANYEPPPFFANGYGVIEHLMDVSAYTQTSDSSLAVVTLGFLLVACLAKVVGTALTLGSGGSGGVFAPALFIGASFGGAFGVIVNAIGPMPHVNPATYALAGMAGVLAGTVHCPLTAFILVFEITRDYMVILPVMLVAIAATVVSQLLMRDSIYTCTLRAMGVRVGTMSDLTVLRRLSVAQVPLAPAVAVFPGDPADRLLELAETAVAGDFVVTQPDGQYVGMVTGDDLRTALLEREALPLMIVAELLRSEIPSVQPDEPLDTVLESFSIHDVASLPVIGGNGSVVGMITRGRLMRCYRQALDEA